MDYDEEALRRHKEHHGKISITSKMPVTNKDELSVAYTPGVAAPCKEIAKDKELAYEYTAKGNMVAVVTDGTAVLGLGDIGAEASLPVMEGKCVLFKEFGGIDAFPIALATKDPEEIIETVKRISPGFGGINLEDISAPRCFEIEQRLKEELDIPVFHDDQHGTAIVVLAGLINALTLTNRRIEECRIVMAGAGAAGMAIARLLRAYGAKDIIMTDRAGTLYEGREENMNPSKEELATWTNPQGVRGSLAQALEGADVFIGVSTAGLINKGMVRSMAAKAIIFALANPTPEIAPEEAKEAGAAIIATGRSDHPNQVNNVLVFPGIFKGALSVRARDITQEMKLAAAKALSRLVKKPTTEKILPAPFEEGIAEAVAQAVRAEALKEGTARMRR